MAKPGDFNARRSKAVDQSAKIEKEAARQIKGMNAARDLKAQQEQVYLRAMQFAHSSEEKSRETNYKLETENRRDFAKARQQDLKYEIENAKAVASQQPEQSLMEELAPLIPKFAEVIGQVGQQNAKNERDAATVAAYQHGFTLDTLQNVLKLNSQLTLSQFQATEYIQGLREQGWAEENINALYEQQYLTRGSKAWVDNKALALNSIREFETGLATHVANMQEMTADQRILEVRNYTQDWLTRVNINGRPLSQEVMGTVIFPKVRSAERRVLTELQKDQIEDRDSALINDRNRNYLVLFKEGGGALALMEELGRNPSAEKRAGLLQWAEQAHKSGALSDDDLRKIDNTTFPHNNKMATIGEHFVDENTAAFGEYVRKVEARQMQQLRDEKRDRQTLARATVIEELNQGIADGVPWDQDRYVALMERGREIAGADFSSPALEALKGQLPAAIIERQSYAALEQMIDNGQGEAAIIAFGAPSSIVNQSVDGQPSLLQRARLNDSARANPMFKDHVKILGEHLGQHPSIKNSRTAEDRSDFEYEKLHREKQYKNEFFRLLKLSGGDVEGSANQALAETKKSIDEYLQDIKGRKARLPRLEEDAKRFASSEAALLNYREDLRRTRYFKQSRETLAYVVGEELFMEATQEMQRPGGQIPPKFKLAAETFRMTPMQMQQYLAPAFDEKPIDTSNSSFQAMVDNLPPQKIAMITQPYGSPARIKRAMADRYNLADAPVRSPYQLQGYNATPTQSMRSTGDQYMTYMTDELGLPRNHALGLLANMIRESSLRPSAPSGDDGGAGGLFQWYAGRQTEFVQKIVRAGDWKAQIKYALEELNEPGQEYLQQNFGNAQEAADWWMRYWERPADPNRDSARHMEILRHWN